MEDRDPDHHEKAIEEADWRVKIINGLFVGSCALTDHCKTRNATNDHWWNEPASVVNEPSEVKGHLFPVVISDHIQRLHVVQEFSTQHAEWQPESVVNPTGMDLFALGHVHWEVFQDDFAFLQEFEVDFTPQGLSHNELQLPAIELVEQL